MFITSKIPRVTEKAGTMLSTILDSAVRILVSDGRQQLSTEAGPVKALRDSLCEIAQELTLPESDIDLLYAPSAATVFINSAPESLSPYTLEYVVEKLVKDGVKPFGDSLRRFCCKDDLTVRVLWKGDCVTVTVTWEPSHEAWEQVKHTICV